MSFKKDFYTEVIRVLNLNTPVFKGGYLIGIYETIPYVVDQSTLSKFDYTKVKVIPVSEEIAQETPSVNLADRSDYIFQYKMMFQSSREDEVATALDAFRVYWLANKQVSIDGYTTAVKTSRGDKAGTQPHGGDFWTFYTIKVFATAIKNGYIWKDADKWEIRLNGVGTYQTLKLSTEIVATAGLTTTSSKGEKLVGVVSNTSLSSKIVCFYNGQTMEDNIYSFIMNKLDKDTLFDIRHTFNGTSYTYVALITSGARTRLDNAVVLLEFDWIEADV